MPKWKPNPEVVEKLAKVSDIDWARIAAYIDGEGCITVYVANSPKYNEHARSPKFTVSIVVGNCDPRMIGWIHERLGGCIHIRKQQKSKWRVAYQWSVSAIHATLVLKAAMPYFVTKKEQAELALLIASTMQSHNRKVPDEVTAKRYELVEQLTAMKRAHFSEDFKFLQ